MTKINVNVANDVEDELDADDFDPTDFADLPFVRVAGNEWMIEMEAV